MNLSSIDLSKYEKYNKKLQDEYSSDESNLILIKQNTESYYKTNIALIIIYYLLLIIYFFTSSQYVFYGNAKLKYIFIFLFLFLYPFFIFPFQNLSHKLMTDIYNFFVQSIYRTKDW